MAGVAVAPVRELRIRDFSGGLNLRDAPPELAANESPDLWNVTLDERGGVQKRLGQTAYNTAVYGGGTVKVAHYSDAIGGLVVQAGDKLYKDDVNTARVTLGSPGRGFFCDFTGKVWFIHPVDGLYSSTDGVTWTLVTAAIKGTSIAAWQNRLLACGDPANPSRVSASAIGDATNWATGAGNGWNNQLRETKDGQTLLGFAAASGVDIVGRPGLVVCKRDSTYRIYDSSNGAYQTLDPDVGAASPLSAVTVLGKTVIVSRYGVYATDGTGPLVKVSQRVDPLFAPSAIASDQLDLVAAGTLGDRCYFSIPRSGKTVNDLALEFHVGEGWFVAGSDVASCYATYGLNTKKLYAGSPTVSGQIYEKLRGGSDNGAAISSWFQTRWFEPANGFLTRLRRLTVLGRGVFNIYTRTDYSTAQGLSDSVDITRGGFTWNDAASVWNDPGTIWGPTEYVGYSSPLPSLGTARSVSFRVEETGSTSVTAPRLLGSGVAPEVGAWALSGLDLLYVQLGIA